MCALLLVSLILELMNIPTTSSQLVYPTEATHVFTPRPHRRAYTSSHPPPQHTLTILYRHTATSIHTQVHIQFLGQFRNLHPAMFLTQISSIASCQGTTSYRH